MARKSDEYFNSFITQAEFSCQAADYLYESFSKFDPETLSERKEIMHEIEHAADEAHHRMTRKLVKEFVTPIEREDIIQLAAELDELTDKIEDILIRMYMYNVEKLRPDALLIAQVIKQCCDALIVAVKELPNFQKSDSLHKAIIEVNTLEEEGDQIYIDAMRSLYENEKDAKTVLIWSEMYDRLEDCCDTCEHVANILESVAMKNS